MIPSSAHVFFSVWGVYLAAAFLLPALKRTAAWVPDLLANLVMLVLALLAIGLLGLQRVRRHA